MPDPALVQIGLQIPLVAAFIWFSLKLVDIFIKFNEKQSEQWRAFLESSEKRHAEGMARLGDILQKQGLDIELMKTEQQALASGVRESNRMVAESVQTMKKALGG